MRVAPSYPVLSVMVPSFAMTVLKTPLLYEGAGKAGLNKKIDEKEFDLEFIA